MAELGQSLLDFGKAVKLLGACEGEPTGKLFSDLGTKSELVSIKLQKEVYVLPHLLKCYYPPSVRCFYRSTLTRFVGSTSPDELRGTLEGLCSLCAID